jgi:two-component system phosphate regulon response regulator PhoB
MSTVCIVDDDPDTREAMRVALEMYGYAVIEASEGAAALETLHTAHADVILLDLVMPGMDGCEFLARQRADPELASIPVVVLSGAGDVAGLAARLGATSWARKPIELDQLVGEIERVGPH